MALSHPDLTPLSSEIIRCAIAVHRELGPSLLESIYQECLKLELCDAGLKVESQAAVLVAVHSSQLLTYMRLTGIRVGLLFNFHSSVLTQVMKRLSL